MITVIRLLKRIVRSFCPVLICAILLTLWGCLAIYNASLQFEHPHFYTLRQLAWLLAGIAVALALYRISAANIFQYLPALYVSGIVFLGLVLFFGGDTQFMKGWFHTGFFSIQPSEFFKPLFCLFICWYANEMRAREEEELKFFLKLFGAAAPLT